MQIFIASLIMVLSIPSTWALGNDEATAARHDASELEIDTSLGLSEDVSVEKTKEVFNLIKRETTQLTRRDAVTISAIPLNFERSANRLERLPVLQIDPEVTAYALDLAKRYRNIARAYRDIGLIAYVYRDSEVSCNSVSTWGNFSYYFSFWCRNNPNPMVRRVAQRDAVLFRIDQTNEVKSSLAEFRIKLTRRYGVEF